MFWKKKKPFEAYQDEHASYEDFKARMKEFARKYPQYQYADPDEFEKAVIEGKTFKLGN